MLIKHEFKFDTLVAVSRSFGKWCISIVRSTLLLVDQSMIKGKILALLFKSIPSVLKIFQA